MYQIFEKNAHNNNDKDEQKIDPDITRNIIYHQLCVINGNIYRF